MSHPLVVHKNRAPFDVYIGRPSIFGNPYPLRGESSREEVVSRFEEYAVERFARDPEYRQAVMALRGKTLGCFCAPRSCHGDVLARLANADPNASPTTRTS